MSFDHSDLVIKKEETQKESIMNIFMFKKDKAFWLKKTALEKNRELQRTLTSERFALHFKVKVGLNWNEGNIVHFHLSSNINK